MSRTSTHTFSFSLYSEVSLVHTVHSSIHGSRMGSRKPPCDSAAVTSTQNRTPSSQRGTAGVNPDRARVNAAVASTRTPSSQRGAAGVNPDRARVNAAVESTRTPSSQRGAAGVNLDRARVNAAVESS